MAVAYKSRRFSHSLYTEAFFVAVAGLLYLNATTQKRHKEKLKTFPPGASLLLFFFFLLGRWSCGAFFLHGIYINMEGHAHTHTHPADASKFSSLHVISVAAVRSSTNILNNADFSYLTFSSFSQQQKKKNRTKRENLPRIVCQPLLCRRYQIKHMNQATMTVAMAKKQRATHKTARR